MDRFTSRLTGLVGGLLAGAGLMYLFDPDRGARRRAFVRDQAASRWRGEDVPDDVLTERVRSRVELVCSEPNTVAVSAHEGCVTLRGAVARRDIATVVRSATWTRGVRMVDDQLEALDAPDRAAERERMIGH